MNDSGIGIIVGIVVFSIVLYLIIKGIKFIGRLFSGRPISEKEVIQTYINAKASQHPDAPGVGLKNKKGFSWWFWLIIAIGLAYLLISGGILDNLL